MPTTPDRFPGSRNEDEVIFSPDAADPTSEGAIRFNGSSFRMKDGTGVFDPRTGGTGLTEASHESLDTLTHKLSESHHSDVTRTDGKASSIIQWTDDQKTTKVRETIITRSSGKVSQIVVKQYDGSGTLKHTMTGTITRNAGKVDCIDWVKS